VVNNRVRALPLVLALVMAAAILVGCGPTPEPEIIIQTVQVEKTAVKTVVETVVETIEVEKEVTVVETVEVEIEVTVETAVVETVEVVKTVETRPTPVVSAEPPSVQSQIEEIDRLLERSVPGNIAHNVPTSMHLDQTIDIQLLLSPSLAAVELEQKIAGSDPVRTASVEITPEM
jgi:hypothetical protein